MAEKENERLELMVCPEGHFVPSTRENTAKDFSDKDRDAMTMQPMFELGYYCLQCDKAYGLSKLGKNLYK